MIYWTQLIQLGVAVIYEDIEDYDDCTEDDNNDCDDACW